ncbi:hypothetical protein B0H16DRAFT_1691945, partial [Mycena metata]
MAAQLCRCPDPTRCRCYAGSLPPSNHMQYTTPPVPQSSLPPQYQSPPPGFTAYAYPQPITFQNNFPATFNHSHAPSTPSPAFRTALGEATNIIHYHQPTQPTKRKHGTKSIDGARKRANNGLVDAPAVFGVGPSSYESSSAAASASDTVFHPAFTNIPDINLGSVLDKPTTNGSAATDVGYFMRGVHTDATPTALPEREVISSRRPDKKEFECTLEKYTTWKMSRANVTPFGTISKPMVACGLTWCSQNSSRGGKEWVHQTS